MRPAGWHSRPLTTEALTPLRFLVLGQAALVGLLLLVSLPAESPFSLHHPGIFGYDFGEFYEAARDVAAGRSPYHVWRFNKPPTVAQAVIPLTGLSSEVARRAFFLAELAALIAACWIAARSFFTFQRGARLELALLGFTFIALSYPVAFLVDRGNLDGFVALFISAGALLAVRASEGRRLPAVVGGVLLAGGVLTKLYPILLAVPLTIARRWWPLAGLTVALGVAVAAAPDLWLEFAQQVAWGRFGYVGDHWPENTSLASTLQYLSRPFGPTPTVFARGPLYLAYAIYAASFLTCVVFDLRDRVRLDDRSWLLRIYLYAPFLVAMPKLSFHYGLVLLLPLTFALLWARLEAREGRQRRVIDVMLVGVLLSQFPSPAAELTSGLPVLATISGIGLAIVLLGTVAYRVALRRPD